MRWEDLKKNISINSQGNRVRFIPIISNNANRQNETPPNSLNRLMFKPFIPKHMVSYTNQKNSNLTKYQTDKENQNLTVSQTEVPLHLSRCNTKNHRSVSLQISQRQQEIKNLSTSISILEKCDINAVENSLPKVPLCTIWTNDNNSNNLRHSSSSNNTFKKPFSYPNTNYLPQNVTSKNYVIKTKFQDETEVTKNSLNTINSYRYFPPSFMSQSHKLYPSNININTSFLTSEIEKINSATDQNVNDLELNSSSYRNNQ